MLEDGQQLGQLTRVKARARTRASGKGRGKGRANSRCAVSLLTSLLGCGDLARRAPRGAPDLYQVLASPRCHLEVYVIIRVAVSNYCVYAYRLLLSKSI